MHWSRELGKRYCEKMTETEVEQEQEPAAWSISRYRLPKARHWSGVDDVCIYPTSGKEFIFWNVVGSVDWSQTCTCSIVWSTPTLTLVARKTPALHKFGDLRNQTWVDSALKYLERGLASILGPASKMCAGEMVLQVLLVLDSLIPNSSPREF